MRVILRATGGATALIRVYLVCFDLRRQVAVLTPAMARCPGLLTAAPRWRRACLTTAAASGSLLAAATPRPAFPQPLPQFLELTTRRLQLLFQP